MRYFLVLCLFIASCGNFHKVAAPAPIVPSDIDLLRARYNEVLASMPAGNIGNWPSDANCDALLWAGLAAAAGHSTDLTAAESDNGQMHRRPAPECYPTESASTISGDMLLGYIFGLWRTHDLAALQRLANYGELHNWIMGEGPLSRTLLRTNDQSLLGRAIFALSSGADDRSYRRLPLVYFPVSADFEEHLQVLSIALYGEEAGSIDKAALDRVNMLCVANPADALFASVCSIYSGDFAHTVALLLDPAYVAPSYVRGAASYSLVHWLMAARIVLDHTEPK